MSRHRLGGGGASAAVAWGDMQLVTRSPAALLYRFFFGRETRFPYENRQEENQVGVNYHDDIYGPEVHEVGPHVVSCMLYIQVIAKA